MKTSNQIIFSTRLSQSEAMLNAIQAGFFEAFLEKREVKKVVRKRSCHSIRLNFTSSYNGRGFIQAKVVNRKGQEILLASKEVTCSQTLAPEPRQYSVDFTPLELQSLLAQPDCTGLRFFPGITSDQKPTFVVVGVQSKGFDIADGTGYLCSYRVTKN
jgi:hypothetical protein